MSLLGECQILDNTESIMLAEGHFLKEPYRSSLNEAVILLFQGSSEQSEL